MCLEPHRLVFLGETGTTTKMTRLRGRAPLGERLRMHVPFGHWHTQTFVAGLRCHGLTAPWVLDGPMNRRAFEVRFSIIFFDILRIVVPRWRKNTNRYPGMGEGRSRRRIIIACRLTYDAAEGSCGRGDRMASGPLSAPLN
jgi:hypothetical protein